MDDGNGTDVEKASGKLGEMAGSGEQVSQVLYIILICFFSLSLSLAMCLGVVCVCVLGVGVASILALDPVNTDPVSRVSYKQTHA